MPHRFLPFVRALLISVASLSAFSAHSQEYPTKPIRMLVGFPPGGGVDIVARMMAAEMQKTLGQPITVENRAGAAGNIATDAVAKAAPDGYTILMGNTGSLAINPALYSNLPFNTLKDLAAVAMVSTSPLVILVNSSQPAKTLGELITTAKQQKGRLSYGTGGAGSISHLAMELLKAQTGADLLHIPYRGGSPAITDLLGGQLQVVVEGVPIAAPFVKSGKLRALAVTSPTRSSALPEVSTGAEAGFPELNATAWYGVMAPAGTPAPILARLNASLNDALKNQAVRDKLALQGSDAAGGTPAAFEDFLKKEATRWAAAVKTSGAKVE